MNQTIDQLLEQTAAVLAARQRPEATYRLQFNANFTFRDATSLAPYLSELGITHCYASSYLKARPGSDHGYDITDHRLLNPEIGTESDYATWVAALQAHDLEQILDVVPNHMAIVGNENEWWNDVLENGPGSPFAGYFDIAWYASTRPELQGRILVPILGEPYGKVLEAQQLRLNYAAGTFTIHYFDHRFPVAPRSYGLILGQRLQELEITLGTDSPALVEYQSILTAVKNLPLRTETSPERIAERQREKEVIKRRLAALTAEHPLVKDFIDRTVALFNGQAGDTRSFDLLEQLLDDQAYRLAFWRVAADEINYRRFFDINELAALSMEREEVFSATHALVFALLWEGKVSGVRIDHIDGLYDPRQYLQRLQQQFVLGLARRLFETRPEYHGLDWPEIEASLQKRLSQSLPEGKNPSPWPLYVIVEKILGADEVLPVEWPTCGTSGYYFLNRVNRLFVDRDKAAAFRRLYRDWIQEDTSYAEVVYQKKILILQTALSSELQMLTHQLDRLAQRNRWSRDFTRQSLLQALREIIACFPVYRTYIADEAVQESDRKHVRQAVRAAMARNPALSTSLFAFVRDMLLLKSPDPGQENPDFQAEQRRFVGKFQQVTAPVMAKGVEDTAFYVYNPLLSLNEVGGHPDRFGLEPAAVHRYFAQRQARWPWAFSATSTHDTKRSEDVRARLNVLSEMPDDWQKALARWSQLNQSHRVPVEEGTAPDANEEYLLYQTLLGAWPFEPYGPDEYAEFIQRIQAYMRKALHEAKVHTSWINPNQAYDEAVHQFIGRILHPETSAEFLQDFRAFQKGINHFGLFNSLAQTLLKITAPGVPDFYQGTEVWDFSLVDPDNRRPVDYRHRKQLLSELKERVAEAGADRRDLARELTETRQDGRIKLFVTWQGLRCRRDHPGLFTAGEYVPVEVAGNHAEHVFSFLRRNDPWQALVAVPRLLTGLAPSGKGLPVGRAIWQENELLLPEQAEDQPWLNVFTGETLTGRGRSGKVVFPLAQVFAHFPVALLLGKK